jgi:hypothetical protein
MKDISCYILDKATNEFNIVQMDRQWILLTRPNLMFLWLQIFFYKYPKTIYKNR